jgi:hypothetical protein
MPKKIQNDAQRSLFDLEETTEAMDSDQLDSWLDDDFELEGERSDRTIEPAQRELLTPKTTARSHSSPKSQ